LEMNRLGMMVDLSHVSALTMAAAINVSLAPVMFSHSSAFGLCNNSRNVPDNILAMLPANGGVVQVNFYPWFISCSSVSTISQVADHIDYIAQHAGYDHVGLGADYDGVSLTTTGLENVSKYPYLIAELIARGWTDDQIYKVIGGNIIRVFERVEMVAQQLSLVPGHSTPGQSIIPDSSPEFSNLTCRTTYIPPED